MNMALAKLDMAKIHVYIYRHWEIGRRVSLKTSEL